MKILTLPTFSLAVAVLATACAKDDDEPADGSAGATEGSTSSETTSVDGTTGPATTTDASAEGSGEESTTGVSEVVYGGDVFDFFSEMGIADAMISVYDTPGVETVSDAEGEYEIGPLPLDPPPIFVLEPNEDYFGSVRPVAPKEVSSPDNVRLAQVSRALIDGQIELLENQEPAEADLEQSIIIVRLLHSQATGTLIEMEPPPEPDTFYAPDAGGSPILNLSEVQFSLIPVVIYFNVAPADAGAYVFTATHPTRECTVVRPDFPTLPAHITLVDVSCPPAG